jgi:pyruvate kinase
MMNRIVSTAESYLPASPLPDESNPQRFNIAPVIFFKKRNLIYNLYIKAVASSALAAASKAKAKAIIVFSVGGIMAHLICKGRPQVPVIVFTPSEAVAAKVRFLYAAYPLVLPFGKVINMILKFCIFKKTVVL